jgi:hypothetical protein
VRAHAEGFIECHDGSITDHFHRAGVRYTAAIETTTDTPRALADEINLIWVRGFIELAARELAARELAARELAARELAARENSPRVVTPG